MDKEAEDRIKARLPQVVRKLKFDFRAAAKQLSAQFGVAVEADWCRRTFAEAHKAAGSKPRPAHQQPIQTRGLPLPPSRSSAEPAPAGQSSSSPGRAEGLVKKNQAQPHDDATCLPIVQPDRQVGLADDTWSFSEWAKNHEAEQKKRQEQRKVLFERVLASMGGGSSESQDVRVPHDIRAAVLERQAQEEKEEQEQESRRQQQWIDEQRAALKNRFVPGSADDEGVDPFSVVVDLNRHDDKDTTESVEGVQSNQELQEDILLHTVLEGMEIDLDVLLTEVESAIGINGGSDNSAIVSELGEVLQFLEQTAAERVQQKVITPTEPPAKMHQAAVLEDDLCSAQRTTLPTKVSSQLEHSGQRTTEATSPEFIPPAQIATVKVASHRMGSSAISHQSDGVLVNSRPPLEQQQTNSAQRSTSADMSNKMGGIWTTDTAEQANRRRGNGNRDGRLHDGAQALDTFNNDSDSSDDDDEANWLQQRRQMKAAVQSYHVVQISSSTTTAAQSPQKRVTFDETVHEIAVAQPNVEEIQRLSALTFADACEAGERQGLQEVKEAAKQAAECEERGEDEGNLIEEKPAVLQAFSQFVATSNIPEKVATTLVAKVTGSYFQSGTDASSLNQDNDDRSDLKRNERMKTSIQQAKERRLLALTQQQKQQQLQANPNT